METLRTAELSLAVPSPSGDFFSDVRYPCTPPPISFIFSLISSFPSFVFVVSPFFYFRERVKDLGRWDILTTFSCSRRLFSFPQRPHSLEPSSFEDFLHFRHRVVLSLPWFGATMSSFPLAPRVLCFCCLLSLLCCASVSSSPLGLIPF